jgi:hypothetical protein
MMPTLPNPETLSPEDFQLAMHDLVDRFEESIVGSGLPLVDFPVIHRFTPGLYIREIFMPAGSVLTSKIHKTEHPFVILKGIVSVWTADRGTVTLKAPYTGITEPGTRRVLFVHEDTVWTTFHVGDEDAVEAIEERIIEKRDNCRLTTKQKEMLCLGSQ